MKTTSIKGVLSFCVAVTVTVVMAYSAVTVIQKNNAATEKAVKESQAIGSEVSTDSLKDGEYEGTATGYGGPLTVRITIKGGKLTDIKVVSHTETPEYFSRASAVIGKILNSGNVNVDSVSGATISSNAIKKAVADALRKAGSKQQAQTSTVKKDIGNVNLTAQNRNVLISNSSNATGGISIAANVNANNGDVVVENSGNGNIELKDTSSLSANRVLVENQTYDISTPRVPEGNYILLGVDRNKATSPNKNGEIIANGNISAKDVVYIQNSGEKGITTNGDIKGGDVAITNNGGAININNGDIDGNKVIISQSNQGEGGVTIGSNVKGADRVLIENAGKGDITIGGNVEGKKVSIQNQTYDIVTPRNTDPPGSNSANGLPRPWARCADRRSAPRCR